MGLISCAKDGACVGLCGAKRIFLFYRIYYISPIPSLGQMAFNVPAVYEVLGARTRKRKGVKSILTPPLRFQGT
jgi:hypothetical protein